MSAPTVAGRTARRALQLAGRTTRRAGRMRRQRPLAGRRSRDRGGHAGGDTHRLRRPPRTKPSPSPATTLNNSRSFTTAGARTTHCRVAAGSTAHWKRLEPDDLTCRPHATGRWSAATGVPPASSRRIHAANAREQPAAGALRGRTHRTDSARPAMRETRRVGDSRRVERDEGVVRRYVECSCSRKGALERRA